MDNAYTQVGDDFRLDGELLVVVSETEGDIEALAQAFFRGDGGMQEWGPAPVAEILAMADEDGSRSGRQIVIKLENGAQWHSRWGTLEPA